MTANNDFVETISLAQNPVCTRCLFPMRSEVNMPRKTAFTYCPRCSDKGELEKYKLKFRDMMNVNDNGYKDASKQYKLEWSKL